MTRVMGTVYNKKLGIKCILNSLIALIPEWFAAFLKLFLIKVSIFSSEEIDLILVKEKSIDWERNF